MTHSQIKKDRPFGLLKQKLAVVLFTCLASLVLSSCVSSSLYIADKVDNQRAKQEGKALSNMSQAELARFEEMKASGDPQGYYFSAVVYAFKHIDEPNNIYVTKKLYEEAVAKGSNDAKVALGNLLIHGETLPFEVLDSRLPWQERDIKRGVRLLTEAINKSCSYQQPLVPNANCHNERSLNSVVPLYVMYRDGLYARINSTGPRSEILPKNKKLAEYWKKRMDQCDVEIDQSNYLKKCH